MRFTNESVIMVAGASRGLCERNKFTAASKAGGY